MPLNIYKSNRMEKLLDAAAERLATPLRGSALAPETLILQSRGMQRWFSIEMSKRFGIWGNVEYPFPNRFIADLFSRYLDIDPNQGGFEPENLRWKIMQFLPEMLDMPEFGGIRGYLQGGEPELRLYQLSGQIGDLFDQYTLFRGSMLLEWEKGKGEGWQPMLWRLLVSRLGGMHRERLRSQLLREINSAKPLAGLPERISLFGISTLPPYHLDIFAALARRIEVNIFILSPCEQYWGDLRRTGPEAGISNPLLASMGRLGRDFANLLLEYDQVDGQQFDLYEPLPQNSRLGELQRSMLTLESLQGQPDDRSIRINSCHSPMREVEVLHDSMLAMFEELPDLKPRDILVMTPDIDAYAPYIEAVFGGESDPARRIPYTVADRSIMLDGSCSAAFMALLSLDESRFEAPAILDILSTPEVAKARALSSQELSQIRSWIGQLKIRWGRDGEHRSSLGLPSYEEQSWQAGIDRLLLGIAMPDEGELVLDTLPFDPVEGDAIATLGKLTGFLETAFSLAARLTSPMTVDGWRSLCLEILAALFSDRQLPDSALPELRNAVDTVCRAPSEAGFQDPIPARLFRAMLGGELDRRKKHLGFMTGSVTFCAMLPMRSIPFRVIALLGMNDGLFPRRDRKLPFDLIAAAPRPGDRSLRDEDRYLFLESLISARELLYISYTGQGERDNAVYPPSVLVSELLDHLQQGLTPQESRERSPVTCHPLQPFSRRYFSGSSRLFSYSRECWQALKSAAERGVADAAFCPEKLPEPERTAEIHLQELTRFFRNPAAAFLSDQLATRFEELSEEPPEREPFRIDPLDNYQLKQRLLEMLLAGDDPDSLYPVFRAVGSLPPGKLGRLAFYAALQEARSVADEVAETVSITSELPPVEFELAVAGIKLVGRLSGLRDSALLRYRCGKFSARDAVRAWLEHLCLCASAVDGYPQSTLVVAQDQKGICLQPVPEAQEILGQLVELYHEGMREPLPFFPAASLEFAKSGRLDAVDAKWIEGKFHESGDQAVRAVYGDTSPIDNRFAEVAEIFFKPYLAAGGKA